MDSEQYFEYDLESSDAEEYVSSTDEDEEQLPKKRTTTTKKNSKGNREIDVSESSDNEDEEQLRKKRTRGTTTKKNSKGNREINVSESSDNEDEEQLRKKRTRGTTTLKKSKRRREIEFSETSNDEVEEQPKKRRTRGTTTLKNFKGKREVEFNEFGQAIGRNQVKFGHKCGSYSRRIISIAIEDWRDVPKTKLDELWNKIKNYWGIQTDKVRAPVLRVCNERWRSFKTRLRKKFMDNGKTPFEVYTFLEKRDWLQFVEQQNTAAKRLQREKGRELAKLKTNPPKLGSKGYRGNEPTWIAEGKSAKTSTILHRIPCRRARNYLLGRTPLEDGVRKVTTEVEEKVKKLNELSQSNSEFAPGTDLLTLVEGKEHGGRTRGVGYTVGLKKGIPGYDKKQRKKRQSSKELLKVIEKLLEKIERLEAKVAALESKQPGPNFMEDDVPDIDSKRSRSNSDHDSSHVDHLHKTTEPTNSKCTRDELLDVPVVKKKSKKVSDVPVTKAKPNKVSDVPVVKAIPKKVSDIHVVKPILKKVDYASATYVEQLDKLNVPTQCALIVPNIPKQITCAIARVHPISSPTGRFIHTKPLSAGYIKVQVEDVIKEYEDLELPSPTEEIEKLGEARNSFIEWPKARIRFFKGSASGTAPTKLTSLNRGTSTESASVNGGTSHKPTSVNEGTSNMPSKELKNIAPKSYPDLEKYRNMIHKKKPRFIRDFYDNWMKRPDPRFGAVLFLEEVFGPSVCKQTVVTSDDLMSLLTNGWLDVSIITYFSMSLHESMQKLCGNRCVVLNPYEILGTRCVNNMTEVMDYFWNVINTREKDDTFFLAPYLQNGHWVLLIICPHINTVFVLDSLGLKTKSANEDNYSIATPIGMILEDARWIFPKCHQQKGSWECGYYVMRWMHEFIRFKQDDFPQTIPWNSIDPYEQKDLDNIVALWLSYYLKTCNS